MDAGTTKLETRNLMTLFTVRNWVAGGLSVGLAALLLCGPSTASQKDDAGQTVRSAIDRVSAAVVRIRIIGNPAAADMAVSSRVTTGLAISKDGFVLTSTFGLTGQAAGVFVEDMQGERYAASVVARDHVRKLALLKCEQGRFPVAAYAERQWPVVGATAIAAGRLYGGSVPSVSVGIVSAVNRIFGLAIQTDAKISPVNYGGPLLDLEGRVLGILVPLSPSDAADSIEAGVEWYDSGIGFAIPIADALKSATALRGGEDRVRGNMGIGLSTRNPLATEFNIAVVHPSSPAARAELQKGDVISEVNGVAIERFHRGKFRGGRFMRHWEIMPKPYVI
jgi:serine protease Do